MIVHLKGRTTAKDVAIWKFLLELKFLEELLGLRFAEGLLVGLVSCECRVVGLLSELGPIEVHIFCRLLRQDPPAARLQALAHEHPVVSFCYESLVRNSLRRIDA